jgi:outer membrane protein assembly factor BamB
MSKEFGNTFGYLLTIALLIAACQPNPAVAIKNNPTTPPPTATDIPVLTTLATEIATPTSSPTLTPALPRQPLWTFQTKGAVYGSPAIHDNTVYFGSDDYFLYAVDTVTQQLNWKFKTGGFVRSRPTFDEDNLYFTSDDGYLYVLDPQSGQQNWRLDIGNAAVKRWPSPTIYNWDYLQSSPVVVDGVVYIGSADNNLYAVDSHTGQTKWCFKTGDIVRSSPAVAQGIVYVGSWDGFIYAVDARDGQKKWQLDARGSYLPVQPSPLVHNGVVYIGSRNYLLYALDAQTGKAIWKYLYKNPWVESSATLVDDVIYVGSALDLRLYAIDSVSGKLKWSFNTDGVALSSPAIANGVAYIGSAHWVEGWGTRFYAVDIQMGQATKNLLPTQAKWYVETGLTLDTSPAKLHGVISSPLINDGVVYFGGLDGKLYAVSTRP